MISVDNYLNETTRLARRDPARAVAARDSRTSTSCSWGWAARSGAQLDATRSSRRRPTGPTSGRSSTRLGWLCTGRHERGHRRRRARRRLVRRRSPRRKGSTPADDRCRSYDGGGPERMHRPADPHRPVGRPLRRGARRAHARAVQGAAARHRPAARWSRASHEMVAHARRARSTSRPSTSSATCRACAARIDRADRRPACS